MENNEEVTLEIRSIYVMGNRDRQHEDNKQLVPDGEFVRCSSGVGETMRAKPLDDLQFRRVLVPQFATKCDGLLTLPSDGVESSEAWHSLFCQATASCDEIAENALEQGGRRMAERQRVNFGSQLVSGTHVAILGGVTV
jgi:hypothetical protein